MILPHTADLHIENQQAILLKSQLLHRTLQNFSQLAGNYIHTCCQPF